MTLREIIENPDRWNGFLKIIGTTSNANRNGGTRKHENQKAWDKFLDDYDEYLQDVKTAINNAKKREGRKRSLDVKTIEDFATNEDMDKKIDALRKMCYKDFEIDAIRKYLIIKKFFEYESGQIEDGSAVVNDRIRKQLGDHKALQTYLLSVITEGGKNAKNNGKFSQKRE